MRSTRGFRRLSAKGWCIAIGQLSHWGRLLDQNASVRWKNSMKNFYAGVTHFGFIFCLHLLPSSFAFIFCLHLLPSSFAFIFTFIFLPIAFIIAYCFHLCLLPSSLPASLPLPLPLTSSLRTFVFVFTFTFVFVCWLMRRNPLFKRYLNVV